MASGLAAKVNRIVCIEQSRNNIGGGKILQIALHRAGIQVR
jgi:hypothetical protein